MSTPQVSAPPGVIDASNINSSPVFPRSPSPTPQRSNVQSPRRVEQIQDTEEDSMDHEPTSPPNEADSPAPQSSHDTNSSHEESVQDEMQVDEVENRQLPPVLQPLPSISQLLPDITVDLTPSGMLLPVFGDSLLPIPNQENSTPAEVVQVSETSIPTPPVPVTTQPPFPDNPPPPDMSNVPPPPPAMDEEEDDFDGLTHFLQHFQEDTSEPPPEQLEEMARQERAGSRNFQLSGLNDEHWTKQVETPIEDPAFVPKEQGKFTWHLDKFHGTKEDPCKERILRSPHFNVGGFKWNIKLFPHGCEGTDYVSVYLECGGRENEESSETAQPWDVAAQIGCVMYNPEEPRTHHFERASHHFESGSPDWGWVRYYGPWQELHIRRFLEHRPMLQNDKLSITAYIRVWDDPTRLLWSSNLKNGQWDSFKETGFRGLNADSTTLTAFTSAMSLLFHTSAFNKIIAEAAVDDPIRKPELPRSPMIQELKLVLHSWHDSENSNPAVSLSGIQNLMSWYGYTFDGSTDVVEIWEALSSIISLERSNDNMSHSGTAQTQKNPIVLFRDRQPPSVLSMNENRKDHRSIQAMFNTGQADVSLEWKSLFGNTISNDAEPEVIAVELARSLFDTKKSKWSKLTQHIKIDQNIEVKSKSYTLRGAVIHRGDLGSGDFYSVIRPEDFTIWLKYRNSQVSYLTNKQAIDIHEGRGDGKTSTDSIAYFLVYGRDDNSVSFPSRGTFKKMDILPSLIHTTPDLRPDDSIPVIIHDSKHITSHQGLGFVDPWSKDRSNQIIMTMRASATLMDVQGELLDRMKSTGRAELKEQFRLWPIRTTRDAPRFVLELDDCEKWPDTQLLDFVQSDGGAHLWMETIPVNMLEPDSDSKSEAMETSTSNLAAPPPPAPSDGTDVVMANTEDEASDSASDRDDEDDDDDDCSSDSDHPDWQLSDQFYVILKTWHPQLLRLSCHGTYFVEDMKLNVMDFVRKTLKSPSSQKLKVYLETGYKLDRELSSSYDFHKFDAQVATLVVSPELPEKTQELRRKAGQPVNAPDWYKILSDRRDAAYKKPVICREYFGGPWILYQTTFTQPRRKSIIVDTKGDVFQGDLDLNWIKNGNGTMIYNNGNKYEGEWKDDLPEGHGVMTYSPSGNKYEGGWSAGRRHGKGVMYYEQSEDQLRTCKICYEEEMNTVLVKCGHIVACHLCAKELKDCPVCRRPVQDIVRMWPTV